MSWLTPFLVSLPLPARTHPSQGPADILLLPQVAVTPPLPVPGTPLLGPTSLSPSDCLSWWGSRTISTDPHCTEEQAEAQRRGERLPRPHSMSVRRNKLSPPPWFQPPAPGAHLHMLLLHQGLLGTGLGTGRPRLCMQMPRTSFPHLSGRHIAPVATEAGDNGILGDLSIPPRQILEGSEGIRETLGPESTVGAGELMADPTGDSPGSMSSCSQISIPPPPQSPSPLLVPDHLPTWGWVSGSTIPPLRSLP